MELLAGLIQSRLQSLQHCTATGVHLQRILLLVHSVEVCQRINDRLSHCLLCCNLVLVDMQRGARLCAATSVC